MTHKDSLPLYLHRAYDIFLSECEENGVFFSEKLSEFREIQSLEGNDSLKVMLPLLRQKLHRLCGGAAFLQEDAISLLAAQAETLVESMEKFELTKSSILNSPSEDRALQIKQLREILEKIVAEFALLETRN